jgi:hypothetical protein
MYSALAAIGASVLESAARRRVRRHEMSRDVCCLDVILSSSGERPTDGGRGGCPAPSPSANRGNNSFSKIHSERTGSADGYNCQRTQDTGQRLTVTSIPEVI